MAEKTKIRIFDLNVKVADSYSKVTPCEICVAMTGREVEKREDGNYFDSCVDYSLPSGAAGSDCKHSDRAQIKLMYLALREQQVFLESISSKVDDIARDVDKLEQRVQ